MSNDELVGAAVHAEPILAVKDVAETGKYWHEVLGFTDTWTWGEPPTFGGARWGGASILFSQNPELAAASKGNAIFIKVRNLESLYAFHQERNTEIVAPLQNKPWGLAEYSVREINGYYIAFAGALLNDKKNKSAELPDAVRIITRCPSVEEYQYLTASVGWSLYSKKDVAGKLLSAPVFAVVAEDSQTGQIIGCALLLGDHASFYYIKDVIVHPGWQSKHVGTALMKAINNWLEKNGADKALVALISGESLSPFYQQFGFAPAFGMVKYIQR
jgi:GNAT superfamily N-acetyltransferase